MGTIGRGILSVQRLAVAGLLVFLGSPLATAAVWYVNAASTVPAPDGKGWTTGFPTIQQAVDVCAIGDAVWVARGVYTGTVDWVVNLKAGVTLYGGFTGTETILDQRDWNANQTIIDGQQTRGCILAEDNTATVDGFTLRNGKAHEGGGMHEGTALNCVFTGNSATWDGGGMFYGTAADCTFTNNTAQYRGGGVCSGTVTNCMFRCNSATAYGGGLSDGTATNCTFVQNMAVWCGGGIYDSVAANCIIWGNSPNEECGGTVSYSCLSQATPGTGNIVGTPVFVNPLAGDFRLGAGSPGIDAGTATGAPTTDLLGRVRPQGAGVDMGAYEHTPEDDADPIVPAPILRVNAASTAPSPDGLTWETAFPTLQEAADRCAGYGGEMWVAAGTYTGTGAEVVRLLPGTVLLGGFAGMEMARDQRDATTNRTAIDGQKARRGVTATPVSLVDGVTIQNGTADDGGGMHCGTATNCTFTGNSATNCGGGMWFGTATNCTFTDNSAIEYGGAMCDGTATNCTFTGNLATRYGGGMYDGTAVNCTFTGNSAKYDGGGMYSGTATNCIFWRNGAADAYGTSVSYSRLDNANTGTGNTAQDPGFADEQRGDFRLGAGSPCINTGTATNAPAADILGVSRPQGNGVDMGAYEMPLTTAPELSGVARAAAHELVAAARLYVRDETEQYHPSIPADHVMRQYPAAGVEVPVDWAVDLVISKGPEPVPVPALVGLARGAAHDLVAAAQLWVRSETERYDAVVPADHVVEQYPGAGIIVLPNTPVDLVISKGPLVLVPVPDLSGLARMAAAQTLYASRLYAGAQGEEYHPTVPQDHVIRQTPEGGTQAPQWSRVDMVLSKGPLPMVSVPDLSGVASGAVQQLLAAAQLYAGAQSEEYHPTVPQDHVIRQTPGGGAQAPLWSRVDYVLSRGPEPVSMPDLVGLARGAARDLLAAAQLSAPNETVTYHASVPANHVVSQSPAAGTQLPPGTTVSYVLSLGPAPVEGEPQPGEGEPVPPDTVREQLASAVTEADTSGDGTLSYAEAAGAVPGLTQDVFDAIDTNGDGQLSPSELAGDDEGTGCRGRSECGGPDWGARMADLLLMLLGALGLGWISGTQRP